jgi:phosphonate transport system substrate-binding protein
MVQRKTYSEVNELLRHGTVQVAIICTGAYLHARVDKIPLEVIAVPVYSEGPVYHSFIIVRAESGITSMWGLKGRSFAFSDPLSLSGHYYPISLLLDQKVEPYTFFSHITFTYSHNGNMKAVLDGIADGAAVDSLVYNFEVLRNPGIGKKLRVIHQSPPLGINPVVVPTSIDLSLRERLREAFIGMNGSPEGQKLLSALGIVRFDIPPPTLYDSVSELFAKVRRYLEQRE